MKKLSMLATAILVVVASGCSKKDSQAHYEDARRYIASQQYNAAVIELKSAVQQAPDNPDYRLALGLLYLQTGDAVSAEKELQRARRNGITEETIALPLVQASFQAGNYTDVLAYSNDNPALEPRQADYITLYHALAELELGATDSATALFNNLIHSAQPDIAAFAQSNLLIPSAQYDAALALLQEIPGDSPLHQEVLQLSGNLQLANNQFAAAAQSFARFLEKQPRNFRTRLLISQALIRDNQYPEAGKHLDIVLKALPEQAYANYLKSLLEFEAKDYTKAKEFADKAISNGYRASQARIIAAIAAWHLGLDTQALHHLSVIERQLDAFPPAKRLYIALQLKAGEVNEATTALSNMPEAEQDLQLIVAAASALVRQGNNNAAAELIARYDNANSKDIEALTRLGTLKLNVPGQERSGIADLEQALLLDPSQQKTRLILASSYLKAGDFDKAQALADDWLSDPATAATGYNLKAYIALLQQRPEAAKNYLAQASAASADNPFTSLLKAAIAAQEQNYTQAKTELDKLLQQHPLYLPAIAQSFAVQGALGDTSEIVSHTHQQLKEHPDNYTLRLALAGYYFSEQQYPDTLQLLKDADTGQALPSNHWVMLIESYVQQQQVTEAEKAAASWYQQNNNRQLSSYIYANLLSQQKKYSEALKILDTQLKATPADLPTITTKLMVLSEQQKFREAIATLDALPAEQKNRPELLFLKGRILLMDKQTDKALSSFKDSYAANPAPDTAGFIATLLRNQGNNSAALAFLEQHLSEHPGNTELNLLHSELLLQQDAAKAETALRNVLQTQPDNIIALNNLAWTLLEQNKLPEALSFAEKAVGIAPDNPDIQDTYGKVLSVSGKYQESLTAFEKSLQIRPENDEVLLNYAEALALSKNSQRAREILQKIKADDSETTQKVTYITGLIDN
ncbi:PEP-CTERM system TPR-repeat protein PrsT [Chromatiaceae bacterium AAb-1]|nr:PEP-CTERM system TPR-repeat protein PrsT [Chromatiaceae bacterium AAb-1]